MQNRGLTFVALATVSLGLSALAGCASSSNANVPSNVNVEVLQTSKLVMRGVAEAAPKASCQGTAPTTPKHMLELKEEMLGHVTLRPALGGEQLATAMLHITHLESNRTWCAMSADGTASIPSKFPSGVYAITVADSAPQKYEVVFEKM